MVTHYDTLGLSRAATAAEIKSAHRALARTLHPDVSGGKDTAARFAKVQAAYDVLSDSRLKREYDAGLEAAESPPTLHAAHFTYRNIAERPGPRGRRKHDEPDTADPTGFEELYQAFFANRSENRKGPRKR